MTYTLRFTNTGAFTAYSVLLIESMPLSFIVTGLKATPSPDVSGSSYLPGLA